VGGQGGAVVSVGALQVAQELGGKTGLLQPIADRCFRAVFLMRQVLVLVQVR